MLPSQLAVVTGNTPLGDAHSRIFTLAPGVRMAFGGTTTSIGWPESKVPGLNGLWAAAAPGITSPEVPGSTFRVKDWVALGDTPLEAVMVTGNVPKSEAVPDSAPVVLLRVTPVGSVPVSEKVGDG